MDDTNTDEIPAALDNAIDPNPPDNFSALFGSVNRKRVFGTPPAAPTMRPNYEERRQTNSLAAPSAFSPREPSPERRGVVLGSNMRPFRLPTNPAAVDKQAIDHGGNCIHYNHCEVDALQIATIHFDSREGQAIPLRPGQYIKGVKFDRVYITLPLGAASTASHFLIWDDPNQEKVEVGSSL